MAHQPPDRCIDGHAHFVPPGFLAEVGRSASAFGVDVEVTSQGVAITFPGMPPLRPVGGALADLEPRTGWMDDEGVEVQYTGAWLDVQGYGLPAEQELEWVRLLNEQMAGAVEGTEGRFRALATVPLRDGERAAAELQYAIDTLGMAGAMVASDPLDIDVASPQMEPFWATAELLGVPVLLHGATHSRWAHYGPPGLAFSLGRTFDTTVLAAKLLIGGLLHRHPALKLTLCHGGGALPYLISRLQEGYRRGTERVAELERGALDAYLPLLYYDTVTMGEHSLRLLLDTVGASHVLLGSDYVWEPMIGDFSDTAREACGTLEELQEVWSGTASRLFSR